MIDWKLAGTVARGVANLQPAGDPAPFEQLAEPAAEAERLVSAYTGLVAAQPVPAAEPVDRVGLDRRQPEVAGDRARAGGAADRGQGRAARARSPAACWRSRPARSRASSPGRVLGQYEFPVLEPDKPARLLFVAPNLAHAAKLARRARRPAAALGRAARDDARAAVRRRPVAARAPGEMLRELLGALELDPRSLLRVPDVTDLRKLFERVREDGLAMVVVGAGRREHARPRAGLHGRPRGLRRARDGRRRRRRARRPARRCARALQRRRRDRSGLLKLLERLIGMDLKLRQYEQGKAFCDGVVARAGIEGLNRVWIAP